MYVNRQRTIALAALAVVAVGAWFLATRLNSGASTTRTPSGAQVAVAPAALVQTPPIPSLPNATVGLGAGDLAPNFRASDLNGRSFELSDYRGHPVLVTFWATWCTSCAADMTAIQSALQQYRGRGLQVVAVNMGDDAGTARSFLQRLGVSMDVALDTKLAVAQAYRVTGLPVTYFLDADGVVRRVRFGEMSQELVDRYTAELVAGTTAAPAPTAAASIRLPSDQAPTPQATPQRATVKLSLGRFGPGTMLLQSPSLRCDNGFCAGFLLQALQEMHGVHDVTLRVINEQTGDWGFAITYNSAQVTPQDVIDTYDRSLAAHPDPLYPLPHAVEIVQAQGA